jgi:hypothetical protein
VPLIVWGAWGAMFLGLLGFVAEFGRNLPFADDWDVVPQASGQRPVELPWLWRRHFEHRIPLPKLLYVALGRLSGCDARAGMYLSALLLGGAAAALILAARRLRGRAAVADAFFPLALLHWGQHQVLLWNFEVQFTTSTLLVLTALLVLVFVRGTPTARQGLTLGGCLVLLPLCGANGLLVVPPLALWLAAAGVARCRSGRRDGALWLALSGAAVALVGASLLGEQPVGAHPPSPSPVATVQTACQFLVMAAGPGGETALPASAVVLVLFLVLCTLPLAVALRNRPAERWRAAGMLCYLAALLGLALAVGWGRAGYGGVTAKAGSRFVTLAVPLLCWCYFAALLAPVRTVPIRAVPWALLLIGLAMLPFNVRQGLEHAEGQANNLGVVEKDIRAGLSPEEIARRWQPLVYYGTGGADPVEDRPRHMQECLEWLRQTNQGPYRGLDNGKPSVRDGSEPTVN